MGAAHLPVQGGVCVLGSGGECLPPFGVFPLRFAT